MEARHPLILRTSSDVHLRAFVGADADELVALLAANVAHLNTASDHSEQIDAPAGVWREEWLPQERGEVPALDFAMVSDASGVIVGRIVAVAESPSRYAISAWIAADHARAGRTRAAAEALAAYAMSELGARSFAAGVTHGNAASEGLLEAMGFTAYELHDTFTTYRWTPEIPQP